jgi:hypothetical protein
MPPEYSVTYGESTAPHDVELSRLRNEVEFDLSRYVKHKNVDAEIAAGEAEIARLKLAVQEAKAKNELGDVISGAAQCISTIATEKQDEIDRLQSKSRADSPHTPSNDAQKAWMSGRHSERLQTASAESQSSLRRSRASKRLRSEVGWSLGLI